MTAYYTPTPAEVTELAQQSIALAFYSDTNLCRALRLSVDSLTEAGLNRLHLSSVTKNSGASRRLIFFWNKTKRPDEKFNFFFAPAEVKEPRPKRPKREAAQTKWSSGPEKGETALGAALREALHKAST